MNFFVGTSGYSYPEWKGNFYPAKMPAKQMLGYNLITKQTTAEGVHVVKEFTFGSNYLVNLTVKLENKDNVPRAVAPREHWTRRR